MQKKSFYFLFLGLCVVSLSGLTGCWNKDKKEAEKTESTQAEKVESKMPAQEEIPAASDAPTKQNSDENMPAQETMAQENDESVGEAVDLSGPSDMAVETNETPETLSSKESPEFQSFYAPEPVVI